jgi:hypothetical protein
MTASCCAFALGPILAKRVGGEYQIGGMPAIAIKSARNAASFGGGAGVRSSMRNVGLYAALHQSEVAPLNLYAARMRLVHDD